MRIYLITFFACGIFLSQSCKRIIDIVPDVVPVPVLVPIVVPDVLPVSQDYFPLAIGNTWLYKYTYETSRSGSSLDTIQWVVTSSRVDTNQNREFTIRFHRYRENKTNELVIVRAKDSFRQKSGGSEYILLPTQRTGNIDTLTVNSSPFMGRFVKGVGMTYRYSSGSGGRLSSFYEIMELLQYEVKP